MNSFRYLKPLGAFAAALSSSLVPWSNATATPVGGLTAPATGAASAIPDCIVYIAGIEVDLGAASFRQCVSYARSSLIGKTDISARNIRSNGTLYRVSAQLIEITIDNGESWVPSVNSEQLASRRTGAVPGAGTASETAAVGNPVRTPSSIGAITAPMEYSQMSSPQLTAGLLTSAPVASLTPSQAAPAQGRPPTSSDVQVSPQPSAAPVLIAASPPAAASADTTSRVLNTEPVIAMRTPNPLPLPSPPALPLLSCDYSLERNWKKLLARSVDECVKKIKLATVAIAPSKSISAYWDKTFINIIGANAYISDDGKSWTLLN